MYSNYSMPMPPRAHEELKPLYIYHPASGAFIDLSEIVYLVDSAAISDEVFETMSKGWQASPREHLGYRLDNYTMNNLFFGEE